MDTVYKKKRKANQTPGKAGRPEKPVKKETRLTIRFTKTEHFIVKEKAAQAGMTVSHYLRQTGINATMKPRLTEEERQILKQLIGMANNLNQLAKSSHQEGILPALVYFETYRSEVDAILEKLKT